MEGYSTSLFNWLTPLISAITGPFTILLYLTCRSYIGNASFRFIKECISSVPQMILRQSHQSVKMSQGSKMGPYFSEEWKEWIGQSQADSTTNCKLPLQETRPEFRLPRTVQVSYWNNHRVRSSGTPVQLRSQQLLLLGMKQEYLVKYVWSP